MHIVSLNYFLDLNEACEWCREKNGGIVRVHSLAIGPHDFNINELVKKAKKKKPGWAILVYKDKKLWINSRFEILDL